MITLHMILEDDGADSICLRGTADWKDLEKLADYMVSALRQKQAIVRIQKDPNEDNQ